eukprot:2351135-Prymnesium_polylepis.2
MVARTPPPTVVHSAGIERVVITLGHKGTAVAEVIQQFDFGPMRIEYVWCEASSWKRGHASNILAAPTTSMCAAAALPAPCRISSDPLTMRGPLAPPGARWP